jgi:hypothetical protein
MTANNTTMLGLLAAGMAVGPIETSETTIQELTARLEALEATRSTGG